jgi:hypothetical protein
MAQVVEVALADGTKLIIDNASEDDVLQNLERRTGPFGPTALNARDGTYRVLPEHVVYVRSVSEDD